MGRGCSSVAESRSRNQISGPISDGSSGAIFFSSVNFLRWFIFRSPFHPRVPSVARKRPRSFCQKLRWQITATQALSVAKRESEWADYAVQAYCGNLSGTWAHTQLVSDHSATVVSARWATVDRSWREEWKSGINVRELISTHTHTHTHTHQPPTPHTKCPGRE